jgi:hypothetical protein
MVESWYRRIGSAGRRWRTNPEHAVADHAHATSWARLTARLSVFRQSVESDRSQQSCERGERAGGLTFPVCFHQLPAPVSNGVSPRTVLAGRG